jgi:hypothetical protein
LRLEKRKKNKRDKKKSMMNVGSSEFKSTGDPIDLPVDTSEGKHVRKRGLAVSADMPATKKARKYDADDDDDQTEMLLPISPVLYQILLGWMVTKWWLVSLIFLSTFQSD